MSTTSWWVHQYFAQLIESEEFPRGVDIALEIWTYPNCAGELECCKSWAQLSLPSFSAHVCLTWLFGKSFWGTNKTTGFYQPQRKECHQIAFETYSILFSFAITYLFNISSFCYSEFNSNVELSQPPVTPASGYPTSSSVHCRNCTHNWQITPTLRYMI